MPNCMPYVDLILGCALAGVVSVPINARFKGCVKLDAAGLALMGIEHSATDKSARLYRESDIWRICRALVALAVEVQEAQAVAA